MRRPRALAWPVVRIAARTSLVVGIVLNVINHAELWFDIRTLGFGWKLALNFLVPYLVATYSAVSMSATLPDDRPGDSPS